MTAAANGASPISVSGASLTTAQAALGAATPATVAAAKTALLAAKAANTDQTLINNLSTVFGAYTLAKPRKNAVYNAWGAANNPNSLAGGQAALHALDVFFAGLPSGARSTRTITADAVKAPAAATITVKIANEFGRKPAGNLTLTLKQAGATVSTQSVAVANDAATFSVAGLAAGTYDYTVSYAGDDQLVAFTDSGTLTVNPADPVRRSAGHDDADRHLGAAGQADDHAGQGQQDQGCRDQGADEQEGRQVQGDLHRRLGRDRQGHAQAHQGQDDQDHHRQALQGRRDLHGAEAGQGHVEGRDLLAG